MIEQTAMPRIIHSVGGLRICDFCNGEILLAKNESVISKTRAPDHSDLYKFLSSRGLPVIGVEFPGPIDSPAEWACVSPRSGFRALEEERAWHRIRTAAISDHNEYLADFSVRMVSYLRLLSLRLFQLSEAYTGLAGMSLTIQKDHVFSNLWIPHIDAAIHAFLADAASFRDLLAEGVWRMVLNEDGSMNSIKDFIKRAKNANHYLSIEIIEAASNNGWIKSFTDLRNNVIHVAPLSSNKRQKGCLAKPIIVDNL